jgi:hypothetical protein
VRRTRAKRLPTPHTSPSNAESLPFHPDGAPDSAKAGTTSGRPHNSPPYSASLLLLLSPMKDQWAEASCFPISLHENIRAPAPATPGLPLLPPSNQTSSRRRATNGRICQSTGPTVHSHNEADTSSGTSDPPPTRAQTRRRSWSTRRM